MKRQEEKISEKIRLLKKQQIDEILKEVERYKLDAERKKLNVTTMTREQLEKKLSKSNSPIINAQSWSGASPGGSVSYNVYIYNPDPMSHYYIFAHVFIGLANIVPDVGAAVIAVDPQFSRLTLPEFTGLRIDPGDTKILSFSIPIPMDIELSNYLGNTFLFRPRWHDMGEYLDRSTFVFKVS